MNVVIRMPLLIITLCCALSVYGQSTIDSLMISKRTASDSGKAKIYVRLAEECLKTGDERTLEFADSALNLSKLIGYKKGKLDAIILTGNYYYKQNLDSALAHYLKALDLSHEFVDKTTTARLLNEIGNCYLSQGDLPLARDYFSKCKELAKTLGNKKGVAITLINLGVIERRLGNYTSALNHFQESLQLCKKMDFKPLLVSNLNQLGIMQGLSGDHHQSLRLFEEALKILSEIDDKSNQSRTLANIGRTYSSLGEYKKALEYLLKANDLNNQIGVKNKFDVVYSIADAYRVLGYYSQAWEFATKSMEICEVNKNQGGLAASMNLFGLIHFSQGKYAISLEQYFKALSIQEKLNDPVAMSNTLVNIGSVYEIQRKDSVALVYYNNSVKLSDQLKNPETKTAALRAIGTIYKNKAEYSAAICKYEESLKIQATVGDQLLTSQLLTDVGDVYFLLGNFNQALAYLLRSHNIQKKLGYKTSSTRTLLLLGKIYFRISNTENALLSAKRAHSIAKDLGQTLEIKEASELLAEIYVSKNDYQTAFQYQKQSIQMKDSLYTVEKEKAISQIESSHELDRKEKENELLKRDNLIYDKELKRQRTISVAVGIGLVLSIIVVFLLYKSNKIKNMIIVQRIKIMLINEELRNKNRILDELNQEKNNFMSILAHDLRSPLSHVKGLVSLLQMSNDNKTDEQNKYYQLIQDSINRQQEMIARILDGAAIDSGKLEVNLEAVNINNILGNTVSVYKEQAEKKQIKINLNLPNNECYVVADKGYLTQVFENLVSNAIKFSFPGKNIDVSLSENEGKAIASIKDKGPGISADDMRKLFVRFSRLSAKPTAGEKSTGLGLSIVKTFVNAMKGEVWCESETCNGSTFLVSLNKIENKSFQD